MYNTIARADLIRMAKATAVQPPVAVESCCSACDDYLAAAAAKNAWALYEQGLAASPNPFYKYLARTAARGLNTAGERLFPLTGAIARARLVHVLRWMDWRGLAWAAPEAMRAGYGGHIEVAQWSHGVLGRWRPSAVAGVERLGYSALAQWMVAQGAPR